MAVPFRRPALWATWAVGIASLLVSLWLLSGMGYTVVDVETGNVDRVGLYWPALIPASIAGLAVFRLTRHRKGIVVMSAALLMLIGVLFVFSLGIPFFLLGTLLLIAGWRL